MLSFSEIPEIVDSAISCGQNEAVEREALHVIGLEGSLKRKLGENCQATYIFIKGTIIHHHATLSIGISIFFMIVFG